MNYVNFGRTGVKVSPLTLGCMMFGQKADLEASCRIVSRALDAGINVLDTADMYARGRSEEITGEALKRSGRRDRVILCTKVYNKMDDHDPNAWGNTRRHIIAGCEASLRRLQVDYIDLYQIHRPHPEVAIDETLRALDDLVRAGKVRYIGTTTFGAVADRRGAVVREGIRAEPLRLGAAAFIISSTGGSTENCRRWPARSAWRSFSGADICRRHRQHRSPGRQARSKWAIGSSSSIRRSRRSARGCPETKRSSRTP